MRVFQAEAKRPLDLLTLGAGGLVAAASATFGVPGDVDVWDVASGRHLFTRPGRQREAGSLAFAPDGRHLYSSVHPTATLLDFSDRSGIEAVAVISHAAGRFALSADGSRLLVGDSRSCVARVTCFTVEPGFTFRPLWSDGNRAFFWHDTFALAPDGGRAVLAENSEAHGGRMTRKLSFRDAETGKELASAPLDPADPVEQVVYSADGSKVLVRPPGRAVKVFDVATGRAAGELVHPGRPYVTGMAVHPNGTVACCRNNGTVCLWDLEKGEPVRTLDWKLGRLASVAFSPDGAIGAAGTQDGQVVVWDVD